MIDAEDVATILGASPIEVPFAIKRWHLYPSPFMEIADQRRLFPIRTVVDALLGFRRLKATSDELNSDEWRDYLDLGEVIVTGATATAFLAKIPQSTGLTLHARWVVAFWVLPLLDSNTL